MSHTRHHGDKAKQRVFGAAWRWMCSEPKAHRNLHKHRPRRAACRRAEHAVMMGTEDYALWPLDKKPWIYYW